MAENRWSQGVIFWLTLSNKGQGHRERKWKIVFRAYIRQSGPTY